VDGRPVGAVEAKKVGTTLTGVELQSAKYREGVPARLKAARLPLPFGYESIGVATRFTSLLDAEPPSRRVFAFHHPEALAERLARAPTDVQNLLCQLRLAR
jgi:type I restriction enzyme R subunit